MLSMVRYVTVSGGSRLGPGGAQAPPNLAQPPIFQNSTFVGLYYGTYEGPAPLPPPKYFFLEPPLVTVADAVTHLCLFPGDRPSALLTATKSELV